MTSVVVGTGGAIGGAMSRHLLSLGHVVHSISRSAATTNPSTTPTPSLYHHQVPDMLDEARLASVAKAIGGRADFVFIASGMLQTESKKPERAFKEMAAQHMTDSYVINCVVPTLAAKHFAPLLPRGQRGVVACVSARVASLGDNGLGGWTSYRASKAALNMVWKNLSIEMGRTHPQALVLMLHPGLVTSRLSSGMGTGGKTPKSPETAAEQMLAVIESLKDPKTQTGGFYQYDGERLPW